MDILLSAAVKASAVVKPPSLNEALSGVFGSISLAAWICLLLPQLIQNYKSQSAEGLSMAFLLVWLLGDVANLSGALWTHLAPTAIALASYFCIADLVLITQCVYYNTKNARKARLQHLERRRLSSSTADRVRTISPDEEEEPLLSRHYRSSSIGLPGSHRRPSMHRTTSSLDPLTRIITGEDETPDSSPWLHNTVSLVAVWLVGTAGYFVSYRMGAWDSSAPDVPDPTEPGPELEPVAIIGLALGYFSAVCYLCARIPQIIKNYREKSCDGLALLFFLLSLTGNLTYGASLIAYSQGSGYLLKALPWLLGSLGTMVEDCIIFVQFRIYSRRSDAKAADGETNGRGRGNSAPYGGT